MPENEALLAAAVTVAVTSPPALAMLLEAAELMRKRAAAATTGSWEPNDGKAPGVWAKTGDGPRVVVEAWQTSEEDAVHIASWSPNVAASVAYMLEDAAERIADEVDYYRPDQASYDDADAWIERNHRAVLDIARTYLRVHT